jgi:hypothetical protein
MSKEELQAKAAVAKAKCNGWEDTHDGSYEACLSYCGYYAILADISKLENGEEDNEIL